MFRMGSFMNVQHVDGLNILHYFTILRSIIPLEVWFTHRGKDKGRDGTELTEISVNFFLSEKGRTQVACIRKEALEIFVACPGGSEYSIIEFLHWVNRTGQFNYCSTSAALSMIEPNSLQRFCYFFWMVAGKHETTDRYCAKQCIKNCLKCKIRPPKKTRMDIETLKRF